MIELLKSVYCAAKSTLKTRTELAFENLALRQQLAVLKQAKKRPRISNVDRCFWILLSRVWKNWSETLIIVQPETVIRWHRQGFKKYWARKSKRKPVGRPRIDKEIRDLIRKMCTENSTWSATQIHGQLVKLGYDVSETTVENYMVRKIKPPSENWRTFLHNHAEEIVACDFFTVPTATFRVLSVFVMINHDRRRIVYFNVAPNPWSQWVAQQIKNAFPFNTEPRYLLHDRDTLYRADFPAQVANMGIEEVITAPKSPWQNPICERVIGTLRRDCLNHCIILNERHLERILREFIDNYYNTQRTHLSLAKDCPIPRAIDSPENGKVVSLPILGGLHNKYYRKSA